jgi:ATP-dependent helicase/nuclease subunit A
VVGPLNRLFASWMPGDDPDIEPPYEPIHAFRGAAGGPPRVELWSVDAGSARGEERRGAEARAVAAEIAERLLPAGIPAREIAILLRALTDLPVLARGLREAGVDFVVDGGKSFHQRPEVVEALALLQALGNPGDPVAVLGVLRSAWGGVPDAELLRFSRAGGTFVWDGEPPRGLDAFPHLRDALERLFEAAALRSREPLDRWIRRVLTEGAVPLLAASHADGPQRAANLHTLAERASTLALERGLPLEATVRTLEQEFTGDRVEGESPLADEALEAVRVLSIHKAKGLEFQVVFLPDIGRMPPPPVPRTRVRLVRAGGRSAVAVESAHGRRIQNAAAVQALRDDRRHEKAESKRLFYVAATRAKERLILVNSLDQRPGPWLKTIADAWGYAVKQWPGDGVLPGEAEVLHRRVDPGRRDRGSPWSSPDRPGGGETLRRVLDGRTAIERARAPRPPRFRNPSRDDERAERPEETRAGDRDPGENARTLGAREVARAAGIAVHRLLESCPYTALSGLMKPLGRESLRAARELGVDPDAVRAETAAVLGGFLDSPLAAHLSAVEVLGKELPMLYREPSGVVVFGYLDLLYRWEGRVVVADYKTEPFLGPEQAEVYRSQLTAYATAVAGALSLPEPPVMELLFLRPGRRVVLPFLPASAS